MAVAWFYIRNKDMWLVSDEDSEEKQEEQEKFEQKYGDILEGVKKTKLSSLGYILIFILRRITMTFICVVPTLTHQWLQIQFSILLSMISLSYLILYKPFEESLMQNLEVFNNITEIILLYSVLSITNANLFALHPFYDALFLTPLVGNICVHFFFLMKSSYLDIEQKM